jgi:hypothetical protein
MYSAAGSTKKADNDIAYPETEKPKKKEIRR